MADAINTGNPVNTTKFMWNKYDDIDGSRVNQDTPRGRLGFRDTNNKFTLPRTLAEARKAVFALAHGVTVLLVIRKLASLWTQM
jgi:hypothetical protein